MRPGPVEDRVSPNLGGVLTISQDLVDEIDWRLEERLAGVNVEHRSREGSIGVTAYRALYDADPRGTTLLSIDGSYRFGRSMLTGELAPSAGVVQVGGPMVLLDQQVGLLDRSESILDNFRRLNPESSVNDCRAVLAAFKFRNDAALQTVGTLSGGEMLRAGLACVLGGATPPMLVVLDEPTNHLDIEAVDVVEAGLRAYDGALLVISHDRAFLEAIGVEREVVLG